MENSNLLVGLDIGTTSIKAVVADSGKVIGAVTTPNSGMRHGQIVDIDQTAAAISRALKSVAEKTNAKIYSVVAGIPVGMLQLETATGFSNVGEQGQEVSNGDVKRAIQSAIKSAAKDNRDAITFLPSRFLIDGKTEVDDPRKMIARSLGEVAFCLLLLQVHCTTLRKQSNELDIIITSSYQLHWQFPVLH